MSKKGGTPAGTAAKKSESRHNQWWEEDPRNLQKCSGCRMVQYCCKEHQKEDWKAHKQECKLFQALGLRATFYNDSDMLARYPLAPHPRFTRSSNSEPTGIPRGSRCGLCLVPDSEESMTRANCCGNILCDTSHRYQLMSYSREFCERSHDRYTLCGHHGMDDECNKAVDWRKCEKCTGRGPAGAGTADRLWRGLNAYNFCPLLSKDVPRHGLCDVCDKCEQKFVSGVEGCGFGASGKIVCLMCSYQGIGE